MKKYYLPTLIVILFCFKGTCQSYVNYDFKIKGSASAEIDGSVDVTNFILPVGTTLKSCEIIVYHPNSYYSSGQNYQMSNNINVDCTSSKFSSILHNDADGNPYTTLSLNSDESSDFLVYLDYDAETEVDMGSGFTSNAPFPTGISSQYTLPTSNIQSNDPDIVSKANSLTSGCTKMHEAVDKIAKWVLGTLQYQSSSNNNADMNASLVFDRKTGNCSGYTNLMIALLRSVDIPARYVGGLKLYHPYGMPYINSTYPMGTSSGPHAVYEIEYPDKGWVMSEPQRTLGFMPTHFIRFQHVADNSDKLCLLSYSYTGNEPQVSLKDMCGTITDFDNNYVYDTYTTFNSVRPNKTLFSAIPDIATGINDKVVITNSTDLFKAGESVSFEANFTSGSNTYVTNWSWEILLYHENGTYSFCNEGNGNNLWGTNTNPQLPAYNWLHDASGNIFGEVFLTATINDGDIVSSKLPLSIEECTGLSLLNKTYSSNTTKQSCFVTMENVVVQSGAKLTVNSEMGTFIPKNFTVTAGSTLEIN